MIILKKAFLIGIVALVLLGSVGLALADHKGNTGCQVDPHSSPYSVDGGTILGMGFPMLEDLGACCIRGHYEDPINNGFPGGCCKHPWLVPGPPPTSNDGAPLPPGVPPMGPNDHPGDRTDPHEPPQVGHGCKCAEIRLS